MSDPPKRKCEACGSQALERLISQTSFQLKGSGWYKDLYSSAKPAGGESKSGSDTASPAGASSDSGSSAGAGSSASSDAGSSPGSGSGSSTSSETTKPGKKTKKGSR